MGIEAKDAKANPPGQPAREEKNSPPVKLMQVKISYTISYQQADAKAPPPPPEKSYQYEELPLLTLFKNFLEMEKALEDFSKQQKKKCNLNIHFKVVAFKRGERLPTTVDKRFTTLETYASYLHHPLDIPAYDFQKYELETLKKEGVEVTDKILELMQIHFSFPHDLRALKRHSLYTPENTEHLFLHPQDSNSLAFGFIALHEAKLLTVENRALLVAHSRDACSIADGMVILAQAKDCDPDDLAVIRLLFSQNYGEHSREIASRLILLAQKKIPREYYKHLITYSSEKPARNRSFDSPVKAFATWLIDLQDRQLLSEPNAQRLLAAKDLPEKSFLKFFPALGISPSQEHFEKLLGQLPYLYNYSYEYLQESHYGRWYKVNEALFNEIWNFPLRSKLLYSYGFELYGLLALEISQTLQKVPLSLKPTSAITDSSILNFKRMAFLNELKVHLEKPACTGQAILELLSELSNPLGTYAYIHQGNTQTYAQALKRLRQAYMEKQALGAAARGEEKEVEGAVSEVKEVEGGLSLFDDTLVNQTYLRLKELTENYRIEHIRPETIQAKKDLFTGLQANLDLGLEGASTLQRLHLFFLRLQKAENHATFCQPESVAWRRYLSTALSLLTVLPAFARMCHSYYKFGTVQFWKPESEKLKIAALGLQEKMLTQVPRL